MGPGDHGRVTALICRALAGIETGVLGGVVMFGWLAASSALDQHSIWTLPNLLGAALNGSQVLRGGFGWTSVSGLGLLLFAAGLVGMVFGLLVADSHRRLRVTLLGAVTGLVWYYFSQVLFWRKLGVFIVLYSPPSSLLLAHLVYGLVLGWFPQRLQVLRQSVFGEASVVQMPETAGTSGAVE
jgi:hypothetical protein